MECAVLIVISSRDHLKCNFSLSLSLSFSPFHLIYSFFTNFGKRGPATGLEIILKKKDK